MVELAATDLRDGPMRVLVLHESSAVAIAVARRLVDLAVVQLAHASSLDSEADTSDYDVVVVCPYLGPARVERMLEQSRRDARRRTSVLQIRDEVGAWTFALLTVGSSGRGALDAVVHALDASATLV